MSIQRSGPISVSKEQFLHPDLTNIIIIPKLQSTFSVSDVYILEHSDSRFDSIRFT